MKKTMKILSIMLIAIMLIAAMGTMAMANDSDAIIGNMFNQKGTNTTQIQKVGGNIVDIITTIGIIVAVIVLLILGIKYMMGSASEKAEYKKTMIPYLVGAVLIFGACAIAKAIVSVSASITG